MSKDNHSNITQHKIWSWESNNPESYRKVVFVKLPPELTINQVEVLLDWAKYRAPESLYNGMVVRCGVKPPYLKNFLKDCEQYVIPHEATVTKDGEVYYNYDF